MDSHYIHHIDSLALTRFCGYQEEHPLTILLPLSLTTKLRYVVRAAALFRLLGSSGDTDGSLCVVNNASYDFRSHGQK
ncbi:hypothetical protein VCR5J5_780021 [Vibrio crassostreae]|uniref:Uncharacterized protein n=1 Tax=Vibrio crassostreae TaxID=246167 RepID=A0A822N1A3_9VIBR|nr:hypothetical protein VCR5J5_780021 [Vibrio crassostreae]